jgi:6-phosphogluconolactonase (cycloisomerase 2 family)
MKRSGLLAVLLLLALSAPAGASEGNLTQLAGVTGPLLDGADEVVVSPDGKHVYAAGYAPDSQATQGGSVVAFSRDLTTGALTQIDCATELPVVGCEDATGISWADGLALSPDGEFLYVAGQNSDAVVVFDRNPADGTIAQASCVSETGAGICDDGYALENAVGIVATADDLYVVSTDSDAIAVFDRNGTTGALTPAGCISESGGAPCTDGRGLDGPYPGAVVTADGKSVYVPAHNADAVAVLDRDPATGALTQAADPTGCLAVNNAECTDLDTLDNANFIVADPDSSHIYVASSISASITVLDRAASGDLSFDSCVADTTLGGLCTVGRGLSGALGLGISADGASVYAVGGNADAIAVFDRGVDGSIVQKPGTAGCIADAGDGITCADGNLLDAPRGAVTVTPDGKHVYAGVSLSDAVAVFARTPNGRPVCAPIAAGSVKHDSVMDFTLACSDPDADPFTVAIATPPAPGTLGAIGAGGKVTYTPASGYVGPDSFTYRASDAAGAGDVATVTVTFTNQAPVCTNATLQLQSGTTKPVTVACTDADGDALTLAVATAPAAGTLGPLDPVARTVSYTAANTVTSDRFAIAATDRTGASATQTVDVVVELPACCAPAPAPTPTPTPTPTPAAPVSVPITQVATLPSPKRCVSRRRFRIRLRSIRGNPVVKAEIRLNGKTKRRVSGRALSLPIDLRGLPKGRWTVEIITTDSKGKKLVGKRRYRTCVPKRRS